MKPVFEIWSSRKSLLLLLLFVEVKWMFVVEDKLHFCKGYNLCFSLFPSQCLSFTTTLKQTQKARLRVNVSYIVVMNTSVYISDTLSWVFAYKS